MGEASAEVLRLSARGLFPLYLGPAASAELLELWSTSRSRTAAVNRSDLFPSRAQHWGKNPTTDSKDLGPLDLYRNFVARSPDRAWRRSGPSERFRDHRSDEPCAFGRAATPAAPSGD